jgi:hypothetical protein
MKGVPFMVKQIHATAKLLKRGAVGFSSTMSGHPRNKWRRIAYYIWLGGITICVVRLLLPHNGRISIVVGAIAFACNVPLLVSAAATVVEIFRDNKKHKKEMQRLQIQLIVHEAMLDMELARLQDKLTPDQQAELLMRMPTGPKE